MRLNLESIITNHIRMPSSVSLYPGQMINGKILKLFPDNLALLQIGQSKIFAELKAPVELDSTYLFQVKTNTPKLELKMIEPLRSTQESQVLEALTIPNTHHNKQLANFFIENNLPLTHEFLTKASEWLKTSNQQIDLKAIKQMITRDLPFTFDTFKAIRSLEIDEPISSKLYEMYRHLPDGHLKERFLQIIETFENSSTARTPNELKTVLKQIIQTLGFDHEYNITTQAENQDVFQSLKALLLEMKDTQAINIKEMATSIIDKITGMQLVSGSDGPLLQIMMQFPFQFGQKMQDITIQWQGSKKNGKINPDYCRVIFYLELENLKDTIIDLQIQNKIMNINIVNDTPRVTKIVNELLPNLKENIKMLNFTLSSVTVRHSKQSPSKKQEIFYQNTYNGVDIRI